MFNSDILEVAIGVIFVFILVSIICSAVREGIETKLKTRAAYLEHGIRELLRDPAGHGLAAWLYDHPLINGLYPGFYNPPGADGVKVREPDQGPPEGSPAAGIRRRNTTSTKDPAILARGANLPSYIPSRNFAMALMDLAARGPVTAINSSASARTVTPQTIRDNIQNIQSPAIQRVLLNALDTAQGDLEKVRKELEGWYDSGMDRVSGWYKRSTQVILFVIGLGVAVALNVDTIAIGNYLYTHPAARAAVVARAEAAAQTANTDSIDYKRARAGLDSLQLPIGWTGITLAKPWVKVTVKQPGGKAKVETHVRPASWWWAWVLSPLLGWLVTGFAATMGAPFWFDILNKVMVIRSTVKPREKSPEEGSEDRQPKQGSDGTADRSTLTLVGATSPPEPDRPANDTPAPPDDDTDVDGCDVTDGAMTLDENLPQAEGGVA
jgi:hypothetical protein